MTARTSPAYLNSRNTDVIGIPSSAITGEEKNCLPKTLPRVPCPPPTTVAIALYSYRAHYSGNPSFTAGTFIIVFRKDRSGWWYGRIGREQGWIPSNYVVEIPHLNHDTRLFKDIMQTSRSTVVLIQLAELVLEQLETIHLRLQRKKIAIQKCAEDLRKIAIGDDHNPISCPHVYLLFSVADEGIFISDH